MFTVCDSSSLGEDLKQPNGRNSGSETFAYTFTMERKITSQKVPPIKIIVVGGAAGGMSAALRARRLDEKASIISSKKMIARVTPILVRLPR